MALEYSDTNRKINRAALWRTYVQIFFVFAAFSAMILISYFSMKNNITEHLKAQAQANGWTAHDAISVDYVAPRWFLISLGSFIAVLLSVLLISVERRRVKAEEHMQLMFDTVPLCCGLWDSGLNLLDRNQGAQVLFGLSSKQESIEKQEMLSPEYQPCGRKSSDLSWEYLQKAFEEGYVAFEWLHQDVNARPIPCEVILVRTKSKSHVVSYIRDLRKEKEMLDEIRREKAKSEVQAHWYESILNAVPTPIFTSDRNMIVTFINAAFEKIFKASPSDLVGQHCSICGTSICNTEKCSVACIKRGESQTYFTHAGVSYQIDVAEFKDTDGEVAGYIEVAQDITNIETFARQQAESAEEIKSFDNLKNILSKLDAMIYVTDPETGEILFMNESVKRNFGIEGDAVGQLCYKVLQRGMDERCDFCPCFRLDADPGAVVTWELQNTATLRFYRNTDRYIDWPDGRRVHLQHSVDITEIKETGEALERQFRRQALMTFVSQGFLSGGNADLQTATVFRSVGEFMKVNLIVLYVAEEDGVTFTCRNEWSDPIYHIPSRVNHVFPVLPEVRQVFQSLKAKDVSYLSSESADDRKLMGPYRVFFRNFLATPIFLGNKLHAILDCSWADNGRPCSHEDVSIASFVATTLSGVFYRRSMERQLIDAKDLAEQSNRSKSAFLADMSHEIRTPMNAILGAAEIELQKKNISASNRRAYNAIYDSGSMLLNIINDLLDMSKIETGKLELMPIPYDITHLINDTVQLNRLRYESKPIEFVIDIDESIPLEMVGDELRIRQILNNLLSNAFKYTEKGEIALTVAAEGTEGEDFTLILSVSDTGQGMTEEQLSRVYDEYARFNMVTNRSIVGTGIGMSITRRLVDMMGGVILATSKPGEGTVFTVRLPQKRIGTEVCGAETAARLREFNFQRASKLRGVQFIPEYMPYAAVLIVDDVESNLFVARGLLLPYGMKIETVSSGIEAVEKIKDGNTYDVVFMDHMMPHMDGMEAVKIIRGLGYDRPVIALTANAVRGQEELFLGNGFDGFISKPIDTRELNTWLNSLIRDKQPSEVLEAARREKEEKEANTAQLRALKQIANTEIVAAIVNDAEQAVSALEKLFAQKSIEHDADRRLYITTVHGLKSTLLNAGEPELSHAAEELEEAGREWNEGVILTQTPELLKELKALIKKCKPKDAGEVTELSDETAAYLREKLLLIKTACAEFDVTAAKSAASELRKKTWPRHINGHILQIAENLLGGDFHGVAETVVSALELL